jgi:hypothetical protein
MLAATEVTKRRIEWPLSQTEESNTGPMFTMSSRDPFAEQSRTPTRTQGRVVAVEDQASGRSKVRIRPSTPPGPSRPLTSA